MSTSPTFGTQVIGQTEKALNAILDRELAGRLTEPQWVTLTVAVMSGGTLDRAALVGRVAGALKVPDSQADALVASLTEARMLEADAGDASRVEVTDAGKQLHAGIRATVAEITQRLWGDLPADELATAGRVLGVVLERANSELAGAA